MSSSTMKTRRERSASMSEERESDREKRRSAEGEGKTSAKKKHKKIKLMNDSDQTDAQRRALRTNQRNLQKQMLTEIGDSMENPDDSVLEKVRDDNNLLWSEVRYTREAVLDGDNLDLITSKAAKQVDRMLQMPRYDAHKLVEKLRMKCLTGENFDWVTLGQAAGTCFNAVPTRLVHFYNGPLDADYVPKERKVREKRRPVEEEPEEEEEEPTEEEVPKGDKLSAVEKQMIMIHKTLRSRCQQTAREKVASLDESLDPVTRKKEISSIERSTDICAVQYLFNPKSFTQTVENMFNFSFLVKKGDARICIKKDEEKGTIQPRITLTKPPNSSMPARQAIVAFNMQDWRDLTQHFQITKGDIPHRTRSGAT